MVKRGTLGASYSYYPICNIDDIALRAARTEFYTERFSRIYPYISIQMALIDSGNDVCRNI